MLGDVTDIIKHHNFATKIKPLLERYGRIKPTREEQNDLLEPVKTLARNRVGY